MSLTLLFHIINTEMQNKAYIPPCQRMVDLALERALLQDSGYDDPGRGYNDENDLGDLG